MSTSDVGGLFISTLSHQPRSRHPGGRRTHRATAMAGPCVGAVVSVAFHHRIERNQTDEPHDGRNAGQ
jgi:hypothetical protein